MKSRVIQLYIPQACLADWFTANKIGGLLSSLHSNTEIISMGHDPVSAGFYITFYNPEYKEVPEGSMYPRLIVNTEDMSHDSLTHNEAEHMESAINMWLDCSLKEGKSAPLTMEQVNAAVNAAEKMMKHTHSFYYYEEFDLPTGENEKAIQNKSKCEHNWKAYQGLTESYEFCSKCDERK